MFAVGPRHHSARRILRVESLEHRNLMSADVAAALATLPEPEPQADVAALVVEAAPVAEAITETSATSPTAEANDASVDTPLAPATIDAFFSDGETPLAANKLDQTVGMLQLDSENTPPEGYPIDDVIVDEDGDWVYVDFGYSFYDAEDPYYDLSYEVVSNTNPDLFDNAAVDGYGGLVLDFADNAWGDAELTIRATDTGGLWVETTLNVHVEAVNDAPVVGDFGGSTEIGNFWTFSGTVTDVDDNVQGMLVNFGGILSSYGYTTTVNADGTFELTAEFPNLQSGTATVWVTDPHGLQSEVAWDEILVT